MRPMATDGVAWSAVCVCGSVILLVTFVSSTEMAEPIEMPYLRFVGLTQVG